MELWLPGCPALLLLSCLNKYLVNLFRVLVISNSTITLLLLRAQTKVQCVWIPRKDPFPWFFCPSFYNYILFVSDSDPGEEQADPKQFLKQPDKTAGSKNSSPHGVTRAAVKTSRRSPSLGKSTFRLSPLRKSTKSDNMLSSFSLAPRLLITTPQARRRSWRRSSLKGTRRRTSLPPLHQDVTGTASASSLYQALSRNS